MDSRTTPGVVVNLTSLNDSGFELDYSILVTAETSTRHQADVPRPATPDQPYIPMFQSVQEVGGEEPAPIELNAGNGHVMEGRVRFHWDGRIIHIIAEGDIDIRRAKRGLRKFKRMLSSVVWCTTCFYRPRCFHNYPCGCYCYCQHCLVGICRCGMRIEAVVPCRM